MRKTDLAKDDCTNASTHLRTAFGVFTRPFLELHRVRLANRQTTAGIECI
jgi:hypothetical protein